MDGLDAAVGELEWDGSAVAMSPLRHIERPWPDEVRARLHASLGPTTAGELCELDQLIGRASADLAAEMLPADLVVSHGQTVHHWVHDGEAKGTLQLGQPAWIVEATGLPVISDVRARDIAAGGHGAPLAGILDDLWLRGEHTRAALNLGGIANVTIVRSGRAPLAFDTGPANCLLDEAARRTTGRPSDEDGRLAARGTPLLRARAAEVDRPRALPSRPPAGSRARAPAGDADGADRDHRRRRARAVRARRGRRVRRRRPQPGAAHRARAPPPAHGQR
jgi:anhydro-N-acetylmuramic acid kinase